MTQKETPALAGNDVAAMLRDRVLKRGGFDFFPYVKRVTLGPWPDNPSGFKFECNDPAGLRAKLLRGPRFGRDRLYKDDVRELSQPDSVHFHIEANGKAVVHLDSVSIVEPAAKDGDGLVVYKNLATLLRHLAVDKWHIDQGPIAMPGEQAGGGELF